MTRHHRMALLSMATVLTVAWFHGLGAPTGPTGEMVWAWHVTIAPSWFDPAETPRRSPVWIALLERDSAKREALLHRIQQLTVERVMFAPIVDLRALMGVGFRVAEHAINLIPLYPFPSAEHVQLRGP